MFERVTIKAAVFFSSVAFVSASNAFTVNGHDPAANAFAVPVDAAISVWFSSGVDTGSLHDQTFQVWGKQSGFYTGTLSADPVTFLSETNFRPGETIMVMMNDGLSDTNGTPLQPYQFSFLTEASGTAGFQLMTNQLISTGLCSSVDLGDLDGDGDLDAFLTKSGGAADLVCLNDGSGVFSTGQVLNADGTSDVSLGDLDRDGDLDAYVLTASWHHTVYLNDGAAHFTLQPDSIDRRFSGCGVELGDLNGDGSLDLFAVVYGGPNNVALNDGTGTFVNHQLIGDFFGCHVALGDLDGDGDLDAIVTSDAIAADIVYFNDGAGTLTKNQRLYYPCDRKGIDLGDVDGDGDLDAVVATEDCMVDGSGKAFPHDLIYVNDGDGLFASTVLLSEPFPLRATTRSDLDLADFDGDGDLDIFATTQDGPNQVYLNAGDGSFLTTHAVLIGSSGTDGRAAAVGDLDGDGDLDVYMGVTSSEDVIYLNQSGGSSAGLEGDQ